MQFYKKLQNYGSYNYLYMATLLWSLAFCINIKAANFCLTLVGIAFTAHILRNRHLIKVKDCYAGYITMVIFFLASIFLSVMLSSSPNEGLNSFFMVILRRCLPFFMILLVYERVKDLKMILAGFLISLCIDSSYAIYQWLGGLHRVNGFYGNPMELGGFLYILMPILLISCFEDSIFGKYQKFCLIGFFITFLALLFNATRGAWLALFIVFSIIFSYYMFKSYKKLLILVMTFFILIGAVYQQPYLNQRIHSIFDLNQKSNVERLSVWASAVDIIRNNTLVGVGLENFKEVYTEKYVKVEPEKYPKLLHSHNNFLQMWAENGIIGFFGFIAMFGYFLYKSLKNWRANNNPYSFMLFCVTISFLIEGLTDYNYGINVVVKMYWAVIGCCLVLQERFNDKHADNKLFS